MGLWISNLFASIQGISKLNKSHVEAWKSESKNDKQITITNLTVSPTITTANETKNLRPAANQQQIKQNQQQIQQNNLTTDSPNKQIEEDEKTSVASRRKLFEANSNNWVPTPANWLKRQTEEDKNAFVASKRKLFEANSNKSVPTPAIRPPLKKSISTPNLNQENTNMIITSKVSTTEVLSGQKRESKTITVETRKLSTGTETVISNRDTYITQKEEKQVLENTKNPYLAKKRLVQREKEINRLEENIQIATKRVERQKKTLSETKNVTAKLETLANNDEDFDEIAKLQEQCVKLESQIRESENKIKEYDNKIHDLELEMINDSRHIRPDDDDEDQTANKNQQNIGNNGEIVPPSEDSDSEPEIGANSPVWVRTAYEKSKNAQKILAKQRIL